MSKFAVLGGAGAMGRLIVWDLAAFSNPQDEILIADYDFKKAQALAHSYKQKRIKAVGMDVTKPEACAVALQGVGVLINSVQYQMNLDVMKIALLAGAHYVDLGGLFHMTRRQLEWDDAFRKAGRLALLGMGAAPGITNLLAKKAVEKLDSVQSIRILVGGADLTRYDREQALPVSYSLRTILEEFSLKPAVYRGGKFAFVEPMTIEGAYAFPKPVGKQVPMRTLHSEVATLPLSFKDKGVRDVSFGIAFAPEFVEKVKFLRDLGFASQELMTFRGGTVAPIEMASRLGMAQEVPKPVGRLRQFEVLRAEARGRIGKKRTTVIADCYCRGIPAKGLGTDIDTGTPPSIAALMIAGGKIKARGALPPEQAVPCDLFFKELRKRAMTVRVFLKEPSQALPL